MKTLEELFMEHNDFCDNTFPESTETSCLHHAVEEICEIWKETDRTKKLEEYVDGFMCLLHGMNKAGFFVDEFRMAFRNKLNKNIKRDWIKNADGSYSHSHPL